MKTKKYIKNNQNLEVRREFERKKIYKNNLKKSEDPLNETKARYNLTASQHDVSTMTCKKDGNNGKYE